MIFIGCIFNGAFAFAAVYLTILNNNITSKKVTLVYFLGAIIDIVFFSVAMGYKFKNNLDEKLEAKNSILEYQTILQDIEVRTREEISKSKQAERNRIAQDLHDDLSNSLIALRYYIDDLKQNSTNKEEQQKLLNIREEVNSVYLNTRHYMHSLNENAIISHYDLPLFLKELDTKFKESKSIIFEMKISNYFQNELTMYQHDQLYFIVNEAISNCIKHANASKI